MGKTVKLRIHPSGIRTPRIRVIRPSSAVDAALALSFSMLGVTLSLVCFTMLCLQVGADADLVPHVLGAGRLMNRRTDWVLLAVGLLVFAKLIGAFAAAPDRRVTANDNPRTVDELPAEGLTILTVPE